MKKLGTAFCLSSALIACAPVQAGWQGNWLVGASGGYFDREGDLVVTEIGPVGDQSVIRRGSKDIGWLVGLLGGYQITCNRWLWGAELNVDWYGRHKSHNLAYTSHEGATNWAWAANYKYKREWLVGLTGRFGYEVAPYMLPYLRLGFEWTRDKLYYNQAFASGTLPAGITGFTGSFSGSENSIRPLVGIGLEVPVPKYSCLTIRAEYDFHARGNVVDARGEMNVSGTVFDVVSIDASRRPHTQTAIVSVVWNI